MMMNLIPNFLNRVIEIKNKVHHTSHVLLTQAHTQNHDAQRSIWRRATEINGLYFENNERKGRNTL